MSGFVKIGEVGVDTGMIWIGDPCYLQDTNETNRNIFSNWDGFINWFHGAEPLERDKPHHSPPLTKQYPKEKGVIASTGFGDGVYTVYAKFTKDKHMGRRVAEIRVVFL